MDQQKAYRLASIIIRMRLGSVTTQEREELLGWLDECEENRHTYRRIIRGEVIREKMLMEQEVVARTDFDRVHKQIAERLINRKYVRRTRMWGMVAAAACVCGFAVISLIGLLSEHAKEPELAMVQSIPAAKVKLILQSGKQIDLDKRLPDKLDIGKAVIANQSGELVYEPKGEQTGQEMLNKVVTAVGGEYCLKLSDGTRVWLNAVSELEYPVDFVKKERIVRLSGEAYFEVAHDPDRPFIVEVGGVRTRVLGTTFNIQAYPDEKVVYTTLLSGRVRVDADHLGKSVILAPGMKAIWEKESGEIHAEKANIENAVAWRYGEFVFDEEDIEVVMRMLERWYEVKFVFEGGRKGKHTFSGQMSKDIPMNILLSRMTLAGGPQFRQEGNLVYVIEK